MVYKNLLSNILVISIAITPSLILNGFIQPYKRGFYCDDDTIRKPKLDSERISTYLLVFLATIPPFIIIFIVNWLSHNYYKCRDQQHSSLKLSLNDLFNYLFGVGLLMMIVDTTKFTIGRHRPNFYETCKPKIPVYDSSNKDPIKSLVDCTVSKLKYNYITNYECSIKDVDKDIHLSFMSGHSAVMIYASVFLVFLIIQRLKKPLKSTFGRAMIGLIIISLIDFALFVGYTRVGDYRHHPADVLAGFTFGISLAIFTRLFLDKTKCSAYENDRLHNVQMNFKRQQEEMV